MHVAVSGADNSQLVLQVIRADLKNSNHGAKKGDGEQLFTVPFSIIRAVRGCF